MAGFNNKTFTIEDAYIPVVFHVLYSNSEEKISEDQIYSQLKVLNDCFSPKNTETTPLVKELSVFNEKAASVGVKFCLTAVNDQGKSTTGINYIYTSQSNWTYDDAIKDSENGGVNGWDADRFLNIWIAKLTDSVSGYAQLPATQKETDGIVIDYRLLGVGGSAIAPYDGGKTLTHLVGNYLGLYSLWGLSYCQDDGIDDTPIHNAPNFGCPEYERISTCDGYPTAMITNYMDNTDDVCQTLFTEGQRAKMYATLSPGGARGSLLSREVHCSEKGVSRTAFPTIEVHNEYPNAFNLFPNPTTQGFTLEATLENDKDLTIIVHDISGKLIYEKQINCQEGSNNLYIDSTPWANGVYGVQVKGESLSWYKKLVIQH